MELLLAIILIIVLFGGGFGYHTGNLTVQSPVSIVLLVIIVFLIFGLFASRLGLYHY